MPKGWKAFLPFRKKRKVKNLEKNTLANKHHEDGKTNARHSHLFLDTYHVPSILPGALPVLISMFACVINHSLSMKG